MPDLHARLLAEIERREGVARQLLSEIRAHYADVICARRELAYLAALKSIMETIGEWRHAVVDDCWYTCAAATEEREGSESCAVDEPGDCDCGLDIRRSQVLAIVAEGLGVEA